MSKSTDLRTGSPGGLTEEHRAGAAWVLGTIADAYANENSDEPVDLLDFPVRIGATAYRYAGESPSGGTGRISRAARAAAGDVEEGLTRGELSLRLRRAARSLGCEWDDNGPVIPKIPGPRRPRPAARTDAPAVTR